MPSDYQQQIKEIFGTSDLDELRELAKTLKSVIPTLAMRAVRRSLPPTRP